MSGNTEWRSKSPALPNQLFSSKAMLTNPPIGNHSSRTQSTWLASSGLSKPYYSRSRCNWASESAMSWPADCVLMPLWASSCRASMMARSSGPPGTSRVMAKTITATPMSVGTYEQQAAKKVVAHLPRRARRRRLGRQR